MKSIYIEKIKSATNNLNDLPDNVSHKDKSIKSDEDVLQQIKADATRDYPNDFSTQKYVIDEQVKAYNQLEKFSDPEVPKEVLESIMHEASHDYPYDFSTQLYVINEQISSWKALNR